MESKTTVKAVPVRKDLIYGGRKTSKDGAQYKPSDFFAIYVGFRCVFDKN